MGTVVFDGIRVDDAEDETTWLDFGSGKGATPTQETDFIYQGTFSVSEKTGTSEDGVGWDGESETPAETYDLSTGSGKEVLILKHIATTSGILNNKGATGGNVQVGSGGRKTNFKDFYVVGGDTYPIKGGFLITPIDPNADASSTSATAPTLSAVNWIAWSCTFSGTSKVENVAMDAIDAIGYRQGLTVTGSNSTANDYISFDEGTQLNRYGIISTFEGINYITGTLTVGDSTGTTSTQYTDNNEVFVFPEAEFLSQTGFFGFDFYLENASDDITLTSCTYKGNGDSAGSAVSSVAVDTRPDYRVIGTSGTLTSTSCVFDGFRHMSLSSGATLTSPSFVNGETVFLNGGTLTDGSFNNQTDSSASVLTSADLGSRFINNSFTKTSGTTGHAINLGLVAQAGDSSVTLNGLTFTGYGTGTTGTITGVVTRDSAAVSLSVGTGNTFTINVDGNSTVPTIENLGTGDVVVTQAATVSLTRLLGNTEISVLDNPSPYSATSLPAPSITTVASTETVSANTFVGDGTNYLAIGFGHANDTNQDGSESYDAASSYSLIGTTTLNPEGTFAFSNFPGVLQDTNSTSPRDLVAGDLIRITPRDDNVNPTLQNFVTAEVVGTPATSGIQILSGIDDGIDFNIGLNGSGVSTGVPLGNIKPSYEFTGTVTVTGGSGTWSTSTTNCTVTPSSGNSGDTFTITFSATGAFSAQFLDGTRSVTLSGTVVEESRNVVTWKSFVDLGIGDLLYANAAGPSGAANSKTVTVEKVDARFQFSTPVGNVIDILAFRTGSNPILSLNNSAETGNIPLTQVGDRNYRDPA